MSLNQKAELDFLVYANAVIKSRAISLAEDNLKPVHRRILFMMDEMGLNSSHKTTKCANVVGSIMTLHPHGDASIYDALVRLAQPWKMRYPLIEIQGNMGNILGYSAAASRYTECRLSPVGDFMLSEMKHEPVDFKPNYDNSRTEPVMLPSMFPNLLCNGNSGIAVGLSASLVPHNFNEVADAIEYALNNETGIGNLIKGPDFPTGGVILNGQDLENIYKTGHGSITLQSKYKIETQGGRTHIVITEIPYLVTIEEGIIKPLKKLVIEEGYDYFYDVINNTNEKAVEIRVVLNKGTKTEDALAILWSKTNLQVNIKVQNMVIVNGAPKVLSLEEMVRTYIAHRHDVITRIARKELASVNHKLTVAIGLEKCTSNIDLLVSIVRNADNRSDAKQKLITAFELDEEQADAILDLKLSRLSRLDIEELKATQSSLEKSAAEFRDVIENEHTRMMVILAQLKKMRALIGDARRTEIATNLPQLEGKLKETDKVTQKWFALSARGIGMLPDMAEQEITGVLKTNTVDNIILFSKDGLFSPVSKVDFEIAGGFVIENKPYILTITKDGYLKKTKIDEYNLTRSTKGLKLRAGDELVFARFVNDDDFILALTGDTMVKIATSEIVESTKLTMGVKMSARFIAVLVANDSDFILMVDENNKGKITSVRDFLLNTRTSEGQKIAEGTRFILHASERDIFYMTYENGKQGTLSKDKLSVKSKTAMGASITTRKLKNII